MVSISKRNPLILTVVMVLAVVASAQTQHQKEVLSLQGYPGQATVLQFQGRAFVDVQDLARITNGSLSFERDRVILTAPGCAASKPSGDDAGKTGFSRQFMRAAIEAMASIREWGGTLQVMVMNGYPVGNTTAGNAIAEYQARAAESISLASAASSNESDQRGLELLRNEFNNVQAWADRYIAARQSLSAANLSTSADPLKNDQEAQNIIHCGQFLAQMFAGGTFQDDGACR
jgi:hypothetical protein